MTADGKPRAAQRITWTHAAVAAWAIMFAVVAVRVVVQPNSHDCWKPFYEAAGRNWLHGVDLYQNTFATCRYSPLINALFAPLALAPSTVGALLWRGILAGAFLGGMFWLLRVCAAPTWTRTHWALAFLIVFPLAASNINAGQANPLMTGLLLAAAAAVGRQRWNLAAALTVGACLLKIYPIAFALILIVAYPRRFLPRFLIALAVGLALPFLLQDPLWVARQYSNWWTSLYIDDRTQWSFDFCYRDLWMLIRFYELPVSRDGYRAIQLGVAAVMAAVCLTGRWRAQWSCTETANTALGLAACWMTVCGPTTEGGGYILLTPTLAWALLESWRRPWPVGFRALLLASAAALVVGAMVSAPDNAGLLMAYGMHPFGGLLLTAALFGDAVRRILVPPTPAAEASPAPAARAA
ncbi:MAG TPA: glycosyltransferase family 87 protein [Gemmataceae bacterium]|nr:glycosyltransferase family 87 protein [Gemmataceae bacterium]